MRRVIIVFVTLMMTGPAMILRLALVFHSMCFAAKLLGEIKRIEALLGGKIMMPCDVTMKNANDSLLLLVWYKGSKPFYSFDGRLLKHWRSDEFFQNDRIMFSFHTEPAALLMDRINLDDEGLYRCRADFTYSPTRNIGIYLFVIIVPSKPFFMDEIGTKIENIIGPYHEGDTLMLSCLVVGGKPIPKLTWWKSNTLLDSTDEPSEVPGVRENQLMLILTREFSGAKIQCLASNNNITVPLSSSLEIELYVSPEIVVILSSKQALSAGETYKLPCYINGSHPLPDIKWWLDGKIVADKLIETEVKNNEIISTLHFTPKNEHNGKDLTCIATNGVMAPSIASKLHTMRLNVFFAPVLTLTLLKDKDRDYIVEGDTIQLRCMIEANPWITNTEWFGNNETIQGSLFNGSQITLTTSDLIIMNVSLKHSGNYSCKAFNLEGSGRSEDLMLQISHIPTCIKRDKFEYRNIHELSCPIISYPEANNFYWEIINADEGNRRMFFSFLNNSINLGKATNFTNYLYKENTTLLCWASNMIGHQNIPCNVILRQTSKIPKPPIDCKIYSSEFTLTIKCNQEFIDQSQLFIVSIWEVINSTKMLINNITSPLSKINVDNLKNGQSYEVLIYISNQFGKSEIVSLNADTLQPYQLINSDNIDDIGLWCGVFVGLIFTLMTLIFIIIFKRRKRKANLKKQNENKNDSKGQEKTTQNKSVNADIAKKPLLNKNQNIISSNMPSKSNCESKNPEYQNLLENKSEELIQAPPIINRKNKPKIVPSNGCIKNGDIEINSRPNFKLKKATKDNKITNDVSTEVDEFVISGTPNIKVLNMSKESIV